MTNEAKDTLLHAVTHDLRTPILGMLMVLRRLQTKSGDAIELSRTVLDRIVESGEHQLILIKSLLEDHSLEAQELALHYQTIQFSELVRSTLQDLAPCLAENHVKLDNLVPANLSLLWADPIQIRQVLEHLITNAVKHNPPGLEITIAAEVKGEMLECTIVDSGVGMSAEQCAQVFTKPYLRGFHNPHLTGLGLGLFLCHQIVTAHQGQIGVESFVNLGENFGYTAPAISHLRLVTIAIVASS
ncbi:MAG: HAMP domain-containing histidine kinase [Leptolyngbyaceae cyanobacterium SU_3_3]|nr:HAMP domain-containing histidine kinase [Leptolyngbyaceae cyanobacterium SU_3_3]